MTDIQKNTVYVDGAGWNVRRPTEILPSEPFTVSGNAIPSARLWQMAIDGVDDQTIAEAALESAVYRYEDRAVVVVTHKEPGAEDTLMRSFSYADARGERVTVNILRRRENVRVRPWMLGTMARSEFDLTGVALMELFQAMADSDRVPVAMVDRKVFFVKKDVRDDVFRFFGVENLVEHNAHVLVRIGVLMKRPGGIQTELLLPGRRFDASTNDGTIMVSSDVDAPRPGTMFIGNRQEGQLAPMYLKGMIRPPLTLDGVTEEDALVRNAEFGHIVPDTITEPAVFAAVRTQPLERCSLNYQALLFGAKDPEQVIEKDNDRLANTKLDWLFSSEEARKVKAGVPPALLMKKYAPWKWLSQFKCRGVRATVYGSYLVPVGSVRMLPQTYARLTKGKGAPEIVVLHRDPAVSNSTSMWSYALEGEIKWEGQETGEGIVINPKDPMWKKAGGDFDGDAAVAFVPSFELLDSVEALPSIRTLAGTRVPCFRGKLAVSSALLAMADGFTSKLGPAVMSCMRLAERGCLTSELAALGAQVIQGAVDAKKHPVDAAQGNTSYWELKDHEEGCEPSGGYLVDSMHRVRTARGEKAKVEAWRCLVEEAMTRDEMTPVEEAMCERILTLNNLFENTQWLRNEQVTLPDNIRHTAAAWLLEEPNAAEQAWKVKELSREYRSAVRALHDAGDDEEACEKAKQRIETARVEFTLGLVRGDLSVPAMVAYGPNRLAAELVSADDFEELGQGTQYLETVLYGTDWYDGEVEARLLDPIPSCEKEVLRMKEHAGDRVLLKVIGGTHNTRRVYLTW